MSSEQFPPTRQKALEIVERLRADAAFRQRVKDDPNGTLVEAGLPAGSVSDFLAETGYPSEVAGYMVSGGCRGGGGCISGCEGGVTDSNQVGW